MTNGGDAAEQIVRMSLNGFEVAAKITGESAKNIAILLYSILKDGQKTKGKARLTGMLRSGKELKVFAMKNMDVAKFQKEAKRYGVLYCVLKDRENSSPSAMVDIIARAEDASKISRIVERFHLATVDTGHIVQEAEKSKANKQREKGGENSMANSAAETAAQPALKSTPEQDIPQKSTADALLDEILLKPLQAEPEPAAEQPEEVKTKAVQNPMQARTENGPLSEPTSTAQNPPVPMEPMMAFKKPSVRAEMQQLREQTQAAVQKEKAKPAAEKEGEPKAKEKPAQTMHTQPKNRKKANRVKER